MKIGRKEPRERSADEPEAIERIGWRDLVIAGSLAALTWLFLTLWQYPGVHPSMWDDVVVATGVRPAERILPGYWSLIARGIYNVFGVVGGSMVLRQAGHVALAAIMILVYALLREILAFIMRTRPQWSSRRTLVMQMASAVAATAFVASDPVWTIGQCFCPTTILLGLSLGALEFFLVFLRKGELKYAYLCAILLGLLAAESVVGFVLVIAFVMLNVMVMKVLPMLESPFFKPAVIAVGKWHMTFLFIAFLLVGIGVNCFAFMFNGGLAASGAGVGSLPYVYVSAYWTRLIGAASPAAWLIWTGVCLAPFLVSIVRFPTAADEEQFLSYASGLVFLFCGTLSYLQVGPLSVLWFWTYLPVSSDFLLTVGLLFSVSTLATALTILGVDAVCRNHQRLARRIYGCSDDEGGDVADVIHESLQSGVATREDEDEVDPAEDGLDLNLTNRVRRAGIVLVPLFLIASLFPGRVKTTTRAMLAKVYEAVREIVREAEDAQWLFTNGRLDPAIEVQSAASGGNLKCLSVMGDGSPYQAWLRQRGVSDDAEDRFSFGHDAATGLRSWIRDKPERLERSAVQVGFGLWKRDGRPLPPLGGMLSRPSGWKEPTERDSGIETTRNLAKSMLEVLARRGGLDTGSDAVISEMFMSVLWRIARMAALRAEEADKAGRVKEAIREDDFARRLDAVNEIHKRLAEMMERSTESMLKQLAPREGLQLALARADFVLGRVYAELVLSSDPGDPDANFVMAMSYRSEHRFAVAEEYLKRCLLRRPDQPAFYNNLAMVQLELGKLEAASVNAGKALRLLPDSSAIRDTKRKVAEALAAKAKGK